LVNGFIKPDVMKRIHYYPLLCAFVLLASVPARAAILRCDSKTVETGNSRFTVLARCGQPAGSVEWEEEVVQRLNFIESRSVFIRVEEWVYNFGPNRFLRVLRFRDGVLMSIESRGYGFIEGSPAHIPCRDVIDRNDTQTEVLAKCGDPSFREERSGEIERRIDDFRKRRVLIRVDEWTYNYGPLMFMDVLTFQNGRLVDIRSDERGY
jgi:hypothetical protein